MKNTITKKEFESVAAHVGYQGSYQRVACPTCKKLLVGDYGPSNSKFLLVRDAPGFEDIRSGFAHLEGTAGDALRHELQKCGLSFGQFRVTHFWKHGKDPKECNIQWHLDQTVKEFKGKTHILLLGNEIASALLGKAVGSYAGVQLKLHEFPKLKIWVAPSMNVVFNSPIGDLILSVQRFAASIQEG